MIADLLPRYYEAHDGLTYESLRSMVIDGHEVAWMKYRGEIVADITGQGREGQPFEGYGLYCECDFAEGVGWRMEGNRPLGLDGKRKCLYRKTFCHHRHLELRREYEREFTDPPWGAHLQQHTREIVLDLIERSKCGEFIGEDSGGASFWGGYFYLQTVADITGEFVGHLWDPIYRMQVDKLIDLDGAVIQPYREPPPPEWDEHLRLEDDGWVVTAGLPSHRQMASAWHYEVLRPNGESAFALIPGDRLMHDPVFGPDVEDVETAKRRMRELLDSAQGRA